MYSGISFRIIFDNKEISETMIIDLCESLIYFNPNEILYTSKGKAKKYTKEILYKYIKDGLKSEEGFKLSLQEQYAITHDNCLFEISKQNINTIIYCRLNANMYFKNPRDIITSIENIMIKYNGIVAQVAPSQDNFLQNVEQIDIYEHYAKCLDGVHLKQSPLFKNEQVIDIEQNPGHWHIVNEVWFGSCWSMWFGKGYYVYIPEEILSSFKGCYENKKIANDIIRVILYEDVFEYNEPENRERQWAFRKFVALDEVAHEFMNKPRVNDDPVLEINSGEFEHGGVKKIIYYIGKDGNTTWKSNAVYCKIFEYNTNNKIVWSETKQIN